MAAILVSSVQIPGTLVIDDDVTVVLSTRDGGRTAKIVAVPASIGDLITLSKLQTGLFSVSVSVSDLQDALALLQQQG